MKKLHILLIGNWLIFHWIFVYLNIENIFLKQIYLLIYYFFFVKLERRILKI